VRPEFKVIIETVTMDCNAGTLQGLDGAHADDGGIYRVWEVDAVSDGSAMRGAGLDDWLSMAVMMKHARAAAAPRATWAFCYGSAEDDAERVMALAVVAGVSPYETHIPEMGTSVGHDYRKRLFGWLAAHPELASSSPAHDVAVLFSSASRDALYPYNTGGIGLYPTTVLPAGESASLWWSTTDSDSVRRHAYGGDYRGLCKLLFLAQTPFDILTVPHADAAALGRYKLVLVPSAAALSPGTIDALKAYVNGGGTVMVTGSDAGAFTDAGDDAPQPSLLSALALWPIPAPGPNDVAGWIQRSLGAGRVFFRADRAGQKALNGDPTVVLPMSALPAPRVRVDTPADVNLVVELRSAGKSTLVVVANLTGMGAPGAFAPRDATFKLLFPTSVGASAAISRPDAPDAALPLTARGGDTVEVQVTVRALALITVR
jgi:hypothetical protein